MIILVGGEKGGSGKSCLAQNIAVYLRTEKRSKCANGRLRPSTNHVGLDPRAKG